MLWIAVWNLETADEFQMYLPSVGVQNTVLNFRVAEEKKDYETKTGKSTHFEILFDIICTLL